MQKFKDSTGREWPVVLNVAVMKKVKADTGVDLYKLADEQLKPLGELLNDLEKFVDVLYAICVKDGTTPLQFAESLGGDSLAHAGDAFVQELIDFFPQAKGREILRRAMKAAEKAMGGLVEATHRKIDEAEKRLDMVISSGNGPASSE